MNEYCLLYITPMSNFNYLFFEKLNGFRPIAKSSAESYRNFVYADKYGNLKMISFKNGFYKTVNSITYNKFWIIKRMEKGEFKPLNLELSIRNNLVIGYMDIIKKAFKEKELIETSPKNSPETENKTETINA